MIDRETMFSAIEHVFGNDLTHFGETTFKDEQLLEYSKFIALKASEAEREACDSACERLASMAATNESGAYWMRMDCASAIRARGTGENK